MLISAKKTYSKNIKLMHSKKTVLLIGSNGDIAHYASAIDGDPAFQAHIVQNAASVFTYAAHNGADIVAVVTDLFVPRGAELTAKETGDSGFTGAAIVKRLRKSCPTATFFLIGGISKDAADIAEYCGDMSAVIRLAPWHDLTPNDLLSRVKGTLPGIVRD